ncbi:MAG: AAA family ATPase, partial [Candidatus Njordarchaeota archaeon]
MAAIVGAPEIISEEEIESQFKSFITNFVVPGDDGAPIFLYLKMIETLFDEKSRSVVISYSDLAMENPSLARFLLERPKEALKIFDRALRNVIREIHKDVPESVINRYRIRVKDIGPEIAIREIFSSDNINRIVAFRALVVRVAQVKQFLRRAVYICESCGRAFPYESDEFYSKPRSCAYPDCPNTNPNKFILAKEGKEFEEYQEIVVQELPEELPPGKLPESCTIIVYGDLVDKVRPGDRIKITGIVLAAPERRLVEGRKPLFKTYVEAVFFEKQETEEEEVQLTEAEIHEILSLKKDPNLEQRIINSICPSVYGLESIKKAIAAQLFGGVPKVYPDGTKVRGDIHILLLGDPGTAKSQLLKYVAGLAPRAIYTSGKGSTAAGLTAAVIRTEDGWALEAGVLVLCDKGIACIDEFDKMREEDRRSIHEALEQQTVSIAKAGIVATLNARTSVLAAANPKYGRYYPNRGLKENLDLPPPILSRFDLIFVLRDKPEPQRDAELAEHILQLHGRLRAPVP